MDVKINGPLLVLCCVALSGCGGSDSAHLPVSGVVTMEGNPVAGALVVFTPNQKQEDPLLAAQGETDETGEFQLQTYAGGEDYHEGVLPGDYVVTVTKREVVDDMRRQPKHLLPKKFSVPVSSPLRAQVAVGSENQFEFDLD